MHEGCALPFLRKYRTQGRGEIEGDNPTTVSFETLFNLKKKKIGDGYYVGLILSLGNNALFLPSTLMQTVTKKQSYGSV